MEYYALGHRVKQNMAEPVVVNVAEATEGKRTKLGRFEPVFFEFPILSERGTVIESAALKFSGTHMPLNGRTSVKSRISIRGDDTVTIKCYKPKGMVLYVFSIEVGEKNVVVTCKTAQTKRKDV
jgi:hypothetical protein